MKRQARRRLLFAGAMLLFLALVPCPRFDDPQSTVVLDADGRLMGARIASDGQWRFPSDRKTDVLPQNYVDALLTYEDRCFYWHPGINPVALGRAVWLNLRQGHVVSGGSTLTMQVARMYRHTDRRTLGGKCLEMLMALKLELFKSKKAILEMYAANAPFGGNTVGLEAACWRYFGHGPLELSDAEAATLAVLPNAPSYLYPGRNETALKDKRDRLLDLMLERGRLDSLEWQLALLEELPQRPLPLPQTAFQLTERIKRLQPGQRVQTSLSGSLQERAHTLAGYHLERLAENDIRQLAILVLDVRTRQPLVYLSSGTQVDLVRAARSTGSILKPFLYAAVMDEGELLPDALIPDIPVNYAGYMPKNIDFSYSGAVPASQALSRSLNVPAVEMLHRYGGVRFLELLENLGFTTFRQSAEHYGLSLILGGGEANLWQLAQAYTGMARCLQSETEDKAFPLSKAACWFTLKALEEVSRPEDRNGWQYYRSSRRIAWKTGTSFGYRDAWAVGLTPDYTVAVWVGNADGEGRPQLTGSLAAAPLLFDVFELLPRSNGWFEEPVEEMEQVEICMESGFKASAVCPHKELRSIPRKAFDSGVCPYHRLVHLSQDGRWQVNTSCCPLDEMRHDSCFVLPPAMEWHYRRLHPEYRTLPPFLPGCSQEGAAPMELLSPRDPSSLFVPVELDGKRGQLLAEVVHRQADAVLYWHLDDTYLGETHSPHQMAISPDEGRHLLSVSDGHGNVLNQWLSISEKP